MTRIAPNGSRWGPLRWGVGAILAGLAVLSLACGGGDDPPSEEEQFSNVVEMGGDKITPIVISSDISVGTERLSVGLLQGNGPVKGAEVQFNLYKLEGNQGSLRSQVKATDVHIAHAATETHADGSTETHEAGSVGVYVADLDFDVPGGWGLVLTGKAHGKDIGNLQVTFQVQPQEIGIAVGSPAPKSVQPILADVPNLEAIDTSSTPDPEMHGMTIADAVASGRPTLLAFATPAFCRSAVCGPVKEVIDDLFEDYGGTVNFVHVEPYDLPKARSGRLEPIPLLEGEWRLETEPWIFVIGADGLVKAKFEAAVSQEEIETALRAALGR